MSDAHSALPSAALPVPVQLVPRSQKRPLRHDEAQEPVRHHSQWGQSWDSSHTLNCHAVLGRENTRTPAQARDQRTHRHKAECELWGSLGSERRGPRCRFKNMKAHFLHTELVLFGISEFVSSSGTSESESACSRDGEAP